MSGFNFTGCQFNATNLTDTDLGYTILTNTTCDYQKAFQDNIKNNQIQGGEWYQKNLVNDLVSITKVYPYMDDTRKRKLLSIASGIAFLPSYEDTELYTELAYWASELLLMKQELGNSIYADQLVCSLEKKLKSSQKLVWKSKYLQNKEHIEAKEARVYLDDFEQYLINFKNGLAQYESKQSVDLRGSFPERHLACIDKNFYKKEIIRSLEGLEETYDYIQYNEELKQAFHAIAYTLSKIYKWRKKLHVLNQYFNCANRIIKLKKSVASYLSAVKMKEGDKVYYDLPIIGMHLTWHRYADKRTSGVLLSWDE